jgi:hypothetical protein
MRIKRTADKQELNAKVETKAKLLKQVVRRMIGTKVKEMMRDEIRAEAFNSRRTRTTKRPRVAEMMVVRRRADEQEEEEAEELTVRGQKKQVDQAIQVNRIQVYSCQSDCQA